MNKNLDLPLFVPDKRIHHELKFKEPPAHMEPFILKLNSILKTHHLNLDGDCLRLSAILVAFISRGARCFYIKVSKKN